MEKFGTIIKTETFEAGDIICHINNWNNRFPLFLAAGNYDVENYSGKNGFYLKLVQDPIEDNTEG